MIIKPILLRTPHVGQAIVDELPIVVHIPGFKSVDQDFAARMNEQGRTATNEPTHVAANLLDTPFSFFWPVGSDREHRRYAGTVYEFEMIVQDIDGGGPDAVPLGICSCWIAADAKIREIGKVFVTQSG